MPKNGNAVWGWTDIEELIQCPVCLDIPGKGAVPQCRKGHHFCANCKEQLEKCPLCKGLFYGTRNFVVEELLRNIDILKNTMQLNNIIDDDKSKKKHLKLSNSVKNRMAMPRKVNTPNASKGSYPCRVVDCNKVLPLSRLLNHVRSDHVDILTESVVDFRDIYEQSWEIPYKNKKPINATSLVVFVRGIGLLYLNIEILRTGHLILMIQLALKYRSAQNFLACVDLFNERTVYAYNTRLVSIRSTPQSLMDKKLCFVLTKNQVKNICVNKKLNCRIKLSRFNAWDRSLLTIPNEERISIVEGLRQSLVKEENFKQIIKRFDQLTGGNRFTTGNQPVRNNTNKLSQQNNHDNLNILSNGNNEGPVFNGNANNEPHNAATTAQPQLEGAGSRRRRNRNRRKRVVDNGLPLANPERRRNQN